MRTFAPLIRIGLLVGLLALSGGAAFANPAVWQLMGWPNTDFSKTTIDLFEISEGGVPKDGIRSIDAPQFEHLRDGKAEGWSRRLVDTEPVIALEINGDARAYPLRILTQHEIANDEVGGVPVVVTYCPLCNAALVYERAVDGVTLEFGTTGKLRNSDLVMYDRQSESWWQQFTGEAIVGERVRQKLKLIPVRIEAFGLYRARFPNGAVLIPSNPGARDYDRNPYVGYDMEGGMPFLYGGDLPDNIEPMARVVAVETATGHQAWMLGLLAEKREIRQGDLVLTWSAGQSSVLDTDDIRRGRDIGNVVVQRQTGDVREDVAYDVTFAFAFHAFRPDAPIHTD